MKKAVIWDLDDTLYLKSDCLIEAAKKIRNLSEEQLRELQEEFPLYSDIYFDMHASGEISFDEMREQRAMDSFKSIGETLSIQEAREFQEYYMSAQYNGVIRPELKDLLIELKANEVEQGVITNGSVDHQSAKLRALGVDTIIDSKFILTSEEFGQAKPSIEIFEEMQKRIGDEYRYFYVGDTYTNDIESLKDSSWKSVWFNHKLNLVDVSCADHEVHSYDELYDLIRELCL